MEAQGGKQVICLETILHALFITRKHYKCDSLTSLRVKKGTTAPLLSEPVASSAQGEDGDLGASPSANHGIEHPHPGDSCREARAHSLQFPIH